MSKHEFKIYKSYDDVAKSHVYLWKTWDRNIVGWYYYEETATKDLEDAIREGGWAVNSVQEALYYIEVMDETFKEVLESICNE